MSTNNCMRMQYDPSTNDLHDSHTERYQDTTQNTGLQRPASHWKAQSVLMRCATRKSLPQLRAAALIEVMVTDYFSLDSSCLQRTEMPETETIVMPGWY